MNIEKIILDFMSIDVESIKDQINNLEMIVEKARKEFESKIAGDLKIIKTLNDVLRFKERGTSGAPRAAWGTNRKKVVVAGPPKTIGQQALDIIQAEEGSVSIGFILDKLYGAVAHENGKIESVRSMLNKFCSQCKFIKRVEVGKYEWIEKRLPKAKQDFWL